ncbi:MAG TPA: hypothetical protein VGS19_04555 [Streptosporangiaceae bacterium]|nr:hypothetical protein [Streptosporangiaceae bacterium]
MTEGSPAVTGLLARRHPRVLYYATLLDLAARGWFQLRFPAGQPDGVGAPGSASGVVDDAAQAEPAMCVLAAEPPHDTLTPYEQRVLAVMASRAGARHREVPAQAMPDSFEDGEHGFLQKFRDEVIADARQLGLSRQAVRTGWIMLAWAAAFTFIGVVLTTHHPTHSPGYYWAMVAAFAASGVVAGLGMREVPTRAGRAALTRSRARWAGPTGQPVAAAVSARDRGPAYRTVLGEPEVAEAVFGQRSTSAVWSGYGGRWRLLSVGDPQERPFPGIASVAYLVVGLPVTEAFLIGGASLGGVGGALLQTAGVSVVCGGVVVVYQNVVRRMRTPRIAEFTGQVVKRWSLSSDDDGNTVVNGIAVDDGVRDQAWAFTVGVRTGETVPPGALVHVRANPRRNKLLSIEQVEPPVPAPHFRGIADPG